MSDRVHRVLPEHVHALGPTLTDCCGTDVLHFTEDDSVCSDWDNVTCLTRLSASQPRPSCEHCGRTYLAIEDAELCRDSVWLLGPDCFCFRAR